MPRQHRLPPSAASLTASMRDIGYSLETAIADLIDNSIAAGATKVDVVCDVNSQEPVVAVIDNGGGMDDAEMLNAMRHGSASPSEQRSPDDLGRFGLGLKTASFSQCRRLTVISRKNNSLSGAEWNLDTVDSEDDWLISILGSDEIAESPLFDLLPSCGSSVLWRNLDRLSEGESSAKRDEIVNEKLAVLDKHLALVFHRFLSGEVKGRKKLEIAINGHPVDAFDPFCRKNPATQMLPEEIIRVGGVDVRMQPYILPHHSKLTATEYDFYQDRSDFLSNQGAYIYRNGRLMAWGDWFRLVPKGEATKLARVQIDFPSGLDQAWTIDIKKSRATPPHQIKDRLRQVITRITGRSENVSRDRGKRLFQEAKALLWERYADKEAVRYSINTEHPIIESLFRKLCEPEQKLLKELLSGLSSSLPIEMIYSDYSTRPKRVQQSNPEVSDLVSRLSVLKNAIFPEGEFDPEKFREILDSTNLFSERAEEIEEFIRKEGA